MPGIVPRSTPSADAECTFSWPSHHWRQLGVVVQSLGFGSPTTRPHDSEAAWQERLYTAAGTFSGTLLGVASLRTAPAEPRPGTTTVARGRCAQLLPPAILGEPMLLLVSHGQPTLMESPGGEELNKAASDKNSKRLGLVKIADCRPAHSQPTSAPHDRPMRQTWASRVPSPAITHTAAHNTLVDAFNRCNYPCSGNQYPPLHSPQESEPHNRLLPQHTIPCWRRSLLTAVSDGVAVYPRSPCTRHAARSLCLHMCVCVCVVLHVAVFTGTSAMRPVSPHTSSSRSLLSCNGNLPLHGCPYIAE
jgi:hypothetical protein